MIDPHDSFVSSGHKDFYKNGVTNSSNLSSNELVWETFAHRSELFPANSSPQGDLTTLIPQYTFSNVSVQAAGARFNNLDEATQIGQNQLYFPVKGKTPSDPSKDCLVLFQAKVNQAEYDYIRKIYNADNPPPNIELPPNAGNPLLAPTTWTDDESIEIKSAWRNMDCGTVESSRYHTAEVLYYGGTNKTPQPQVGTFGLIGLHILRKMKNYPAFVYTTFEHVDNMNSGAYFIALYNDMQYDPPIDNIPTAIVNDGTKLFSVKLPLAGKVQASNGYQFTSFDPTSHYTLSPDFAGPIMAEPSPALTQAVKDVNTEVKNLLDSLPEFNNSVWKNYRLAGVQILPVNEDSSTSGKREPLTEDFFLANNVIESSQPGVQLFKGGVSDPDTRGANATQLLNLRTDANVTNITALPNSSNVTMGGCMGCHGNARYPSDKEGVQIGPNPTSIFNFLINSSTTMRGTGFEADGRSATTLELKAKASRYRRLFK
jgi:hypothetical protein